ncbi:MAG: hypothetical protein ACRDI0_09125 [Actinomycetota bacterium]
MKLRWLAASVMMLALVACSTEAGPTAGVAASPTGDAGRWLRDLEEPYPFTTPIPPLAPTPIDGTYARDYREGSEPPPCLRCAPYRLDRGEAVLDLHGGRYHLDQPGSRFRARGHYLVEGNRFVLFNDANCPHTRGVYLWTLDEGGHLTLSVVDDPCPFDLLRARYLSAMPWAASTG